MIKKDKLKAETQQKSESIENVDKLSFMFESLCRIFKTRNQNEILRIAEKMQNEAGLNNDYIKF